MGTHKNQPSLVSKDLDYAKDSITHKFVTDMAGNLPDRDKCRQMITDPYYNLHAFTPVLETGCLSPDELMAGLLERMRTYHPSDDLSMIEKAYETASKAHEGQMRKSGDPYIVHPLWVCIILASLEMDRETIMAAMLHDVVEDTAYNEDSIREAFGDDVARLVDGVTKLGQIDYSSDRLEAQAQNLRKMFLAMAKDIRVIVIKLADRLHNMWTLQYMKPEKQIEKAEETLDIYAPIAGRLGIYKIQSELEDTSLKFLKPDVYNSIIEQLEEYHSQRDKFINKTVGDVAKHMEEAHIKAEVFGRVKHVFSIYRKMVQQDKTSIDEIYDIFATRIIVETVQDCYAALGTIHDLYTPVPGRFKDYIAMPKPNMYRSLHTTLIGEEGKPFEVQIRTQEMHRIAEYGIAAHWQYKESGGSDEQASESGEEAKLTWLRRILEWQQDTSDNKEFLSTVKGDLDLFAGDVYCFTPQGDVKTLPAGSTPIDFAYAIHSAVGNKMVGARVNGKLANIDYKIQNGDRIEIITSQNTKGPSRDWLKIVKSTQAKSKINQWFKKEFKEENIVKGRAMLEQYCREKKCDLNDLLEPAYMETVMKKYGFKEWDAVLAAVGHGGIKEGQIVNRLRQAYRNDHKNEYFEEQVKNLDKTGKNMEEHVLRSKSGVIVKGVGDMAVHFSKCCNPVPGDEIVGFITRGRGLSIHRTDCTNVMNLSEQERARLIPAEWADMPKEGGSYAVDIIIYARNRKGLLMDLAKVFVENGVDLKSMNIKVNKQNVASINAGFEVQSRSDVRDISQKLRKISDVIDIQRPR